MFAVKPRLLAVFGPMDYAPMSISYCPKYDETQDILVWGDDGGYVNILLFNKRFFVDHISEDKSIYLDPIVLQRPDMQAKYHMMFKRVSKNIR